MSCTRRFEDPLIKRAMRKNQIALFTSQKQSWKTPEEFYQIIDAEFHFDFDPCPENRLIKAFGPLQSNFDGLTMQWKKRNFVNPPYNEVTQWIKKGVEENQKGNMVVFLVPARTDTKWFQDYVLPFATEIRFIRGRLKFIDPSTNKEKAPTPFPSMLVIFSEKEMAT